MKSSPLPTLISTRSFAYDDENQLTSVWVTNAWRSDFAYDGLMRRRLRKEFTWSGGTWVQTKVRKRMLKNGIVRPNEPVHHWLFHQASKVPEWIKNRPFNLMPISQEAHDLAHYGNLAQRLWNGTPGWAWQTAGGFGYAAASQAGQAVANLPQGGGCY